MKLTEEQEKRRRSRNLAILAILCGMVVLFYILGMVKFGGG